MIGEDQRRAPVVAQCRYVIYLGYQLIILFGKAAVLYPANTRFAGNDSLLQVAAVCQILCEVVEFGNVFFHAIFLIVHALFFIQWRSIYAYLPPLFL